LIAAVLGGETIGLLCCLCDKAFQIKKVTDWSMARVEQFFGRRADFQTSETLKRREESHQDCHSRGPLLQGDIHVDQLIHGLSDSDDIGESTA
jgi:hypothetical protein